MIRSNSQSDLTLRTKSFNNKVVLRPHFDSWRHLSKVDSKIVVIYVVMQDYNYFGCFIFQNLKVFERDSSQKTFILKNVVKFYWTRFLTEQISFLTEQISFLTEQISPLKMVLLATPHLITLSCFEPVILNLKCKVSKTLELFQLCVKVFLIYVCCLQGLP